MLSGSCYKLCQNEKLVENNNSTAIAAAATMINITIATTKRSSVSLSSSPMSAN
jgi:hypothetical protein